MQDESSNNSGHDTLPGGAVRYTANSKPSGGLTIGRQATVADNPTNGTFQHDRNGVTHSGQISNNADALINRGSVLGTFKNSSGSPSSRHAKEGSVCLSPGDESTRTSVAVALQLGYLTTGPDGTYMDKLTRQEAEAAVEEDSRPPKEETPEAELFDPQTEAAFGQAVSPYQQPHFDHAQVSGSLAVQQGADEGTIIDQVSKQLAEAEGGDPADHRRAVELGIKGYQRQVGGLLAAEGIPAADQQVVWSWVRSQPSGRDMLGQALNQLTAARSLSGFRSIVDSFFKSASPPISSLKAMGCRVRGTGSDAQVERADGSWMPVSAVRYSRRGD